MGRHKLNKRLHSKNKKNKNITFFLVTQKHLNIRQEVVNSKTRENFFYLTQPFFCSPVSVKVLEPLVSRAYTSFAFWCHLSPGSPCFLLKLRNNICVVAKISNLSF